MKQFTSYGSRASGKITTAYQVTRPIYDILRCQSVYTGYVVSNKIK